MNYLSIILSCLFLSGCVGSYFVFNDKESKEFESLHSVPERPHFTPQKVHTQEEHRLQEEHQQNMLKNQELRKKAQLIEDQVLNATLIKKK